MGKWVFPVPSFAWTSSRYGYRTNPITRKKQFHTGVDLAIVAGQPIYAARPGKVLRAAYVGTYGNLVELDHGSGITTRYAHCSKFAVKKGDQVRAGQTIAYVGSTGRSTGPHLHFEIRFNGYHTNPLNYISRNDTIKNYDGNIGQSISAPGGGVPDGGSFFTQTEQAKGKEITEVVSIGEDKKTGSNYADLQDKSRGGWIDIIIKNKGIVYEVCVEGDVIISYERKGSPGTLEFNVLKTPNLDFQEGNPVKVRKNNTDIFSGYIFTKERSDADVIKCKAYDQIRYLKNKDSMAYKNQTYSELLKSIAATYKLKLGTVEDTKYKIPARIEEGTLIDILGNASDLTILNTGKMYVLYDDVGKLTLKNIESMVLPLLITEDTAEGYNYSTTIDEDVYNRVKLAYDNSDTGQRETYTVNDTDRQNLWGTLQLYEKVDDKNGLKQQAEFLLEHYGKKKRSLEITKCLGDIRVRGGSLLMSYLNLGDTILKQYVMVESVKHTFSESEHFMDLTVVGIKGGDY